MSGLSTLKDSEDALKETLSLINVVPNPYYAYSQYERTKIDSRVKITNLPQKCTIRIYSASGKLMKTFKKDSPQTFIDWDLNNEIGIQTASGVYLIHVEVPGIGERVIKLFAAMRQVDLQNF
jgi:flagellar hook assembly protein FlgD